MADDSELAVWIGGRHAGGLRRDGADILFVYDEAYRASRGPALSVSMPKRRVEHGPAVAGPWFDNLLPDNDSVRDRWAAAFGERRTTAFSLLRHMGAGCAGAVQVLPPGTPPDTDAGHEPISDAIIEERLRALRRDDTAWNLEGHGGRWSLGGAQGKFALACAADGTWEAPTGHAASTHIFKVGADLFDNDDAAEYVTMRAATILGIPASRTELRRFGDQTAMISQRFDRNIAPDGTVERLHQEDLCQALGLSRALEYQSNGGPSPESIGKVLTDAADPRDLDSSRHLFAQALVYNWLVGGTDAHAKNYSLLHIGARVRMAPLYDLTSAALLIPADELRHRGKLAMKLGGEYRLKAVRARHLHRAAVAIGVDPDWMLTTTKQLANNLPLAMEQAINEAGDVLSDTTRKSFTAAINERIHSARSTLSQPDADRSKPDVVGGVGASEPSGAGDVWINAHTRKGSTSKDIGASAPAAGESCESGPLPARQKRAAPEMRVRRTVSNAAKSVDAWRPSAAKVRCPQFGGRIIRSWRLGGGGSGAGAAGGGTSKRAEV